MFSSIPLLDRITRILQIFDTSLGICIEAEVITLLRLRRGMRGFRVLKTAALPCPPEAELPERIREVIDRERMHAAYTVVGIPRAAVLLKQCAIPLMPVGEIEGYLASHPELFLPQGLESGPFQCRFYCLAADETQLHLQLLIFRTAQAEHYGRMLTGLPVWRLFAGNLGLIGLGNPGAGKFSGIVLHAGTDELAALRFRGGRLISYAEMRASLAATGGASGYAAHFRRWWLERFSREKLAETCLLYGMAPEKPVIAAALQHLGVEPVESDAEPGAGQFTHALALSLAPFGGPAAELSLRLPTDAGNADAVFYRQLTLKSALLLSVVILFAGGGFGLINVSMAGQLRQEALRREALIPLAALRDSLAQRLDSLSHSRDNLNRLTGHRTEYAFYLYRLASLLPDGLWLRGVRMDALSAGGLNVQLAGQSRDAAQMMRFLSTLETQPFVAEMLLEDMAVRPGGREAGQCEFRVRFYVAD